VWQTGYRTKQYGHAATRSVAAGRQGTVLQVPKGRSRLFPDVSGFFCFENVHFEISMTKFRVQPGFYEGRANMFPLWITSARLAAELCRMDTAWEV
jgi:hypothetical protein